MQQFEYLVLAERNSKKRPSLRILSRNQQIFTQIYANPSPTQISGNPSVYAILSMFVLLYYTQIILLKRGKISLAFAMYKNHRKPVFDTNASGGANLQKS